MLTRTRLSFCLTLPALLMAAPVEATTKDKTPINLIISEKTCFLHLIDKASGWSPHCGSVDFRYLGIPEPGSKEKQLLQEYAAARKPLEWDEESPLFAWAHQGFPLQGKPEAYGRLKKVLDQFYALPAFSAPLAKRAGALQLLEPKILEQIKLIPTLLAPLRPVTEAFQHVDAKPWHAVPLYAVYTVCNHGTQGGANGPSVYAELFPDAAPEDIKECGNTFLHEGLHVSLRPRKCFKALLCKHPGQTCQAKHGLLEQCAPREMGGDEYEMLDEILVYSLSNVLVGGMNPDAQYQNYQKQKSKTYQRLWDGVRILLPLIKQQLDKPQAKELFLAQLIDGFLDKVHFSVWKAPKA